MRKALILLLLLVIVPLVAEGQPRLSACEMAWDNPATNADGTALTDLAGVRLMASQTQGGPYDVPVADVATTEPGKVGVTAPCAFPNDGTWYVVAMAYDMTDPANLSEPSNELALVWDHTAPAAVTIQISVNVTVNVQ